MTFEQIQTKLDVLKANLEKLDELPQSSLAEFTGDFRNVATALYLLQTSIQALIDLASYLVARNSLRTPRTSHELFERLEDAGKLPAGTTRRVGPIVGFRNRVVHLYDRIDEGKVYNVLKDHRSDLVELLDLLLAALEQEPDR